MQSLRHIAVTVEEPDAGQFAWVLIERLGRTWRELARSDAPVAGYAGAMAEGLLALQSLVDDLEIGPRVGDEDASEKSSGEVHEPAARKRASDKAPAPGKSFFGFGPAR